MRETAGRLLRFGVGYGTTTVAAVAAVGLLLPVSYRTVLLGLTFLALVGAAVLLSGGDNPAKVEDPDPMPDWRKDWLVYVAGVFVLGWVAIRLPLQL